MILPVRGAKAATSDVTAMWEYTPLHLSKTLGPFLMILPVRGTKVLISDVTAMWRLYIGT